MEANIIVILISITLFLAYIGGILYTKTHVRDIFWLIAFGAILGPVTKLIDPAAMSGLAPMLVLMALNLLMFEAGMNVDLKTFKETMEKSGYLGVITFVLTTFIIGNGLFYLLPDLFTFTEALLLGSMIGGTSTSTVVVWVQMLNIARNRPFNYIMTIAALFFSYILAEQMGGPGAGALAALVFGITLTNYPLFARQLKLNERVRIERKRLRGFHEEITFLIKSFLFLFVGLQMRLDWVYLGIGVGIAITIGAVRFISVFFTNMFTPLTEIEIKISRIEFSNGLTAIVLAQLPLLVDGDLFTDPSIFSALVVPAVLTTALFGSLLGPVLFNRQKKVPEDNIESQVEVNE